MAYIQRNGESDLEFARRIDREFNDKAKKNPNDYRYKPVTNKVSESRIKEYKEKHSKASTGGASVKVLKTKGLVPNESDMFGKYGKLGLIACAFLFVVGVFK